LNIFIENLYKCEVVIYKGDSLVKAGLFLRSSGWIIPPKGYLSSAFCFGEGIDMIQIWIRKI